MTARTPLPPPDRAAARAFWKQFRAAHPTATMRDDDLAVEQFGDSVELANKLLDLVMHGPKRATAGLVSEFEAAGEPLPRVGSYWVACDGAGAPRVVLRSVELRVGVAESVDDAFAWDEGEGDRSRADWLRMHRAYWGRTAAARGDEWSEDTEVVFERFRVVWPPELAD